MPRYGDLGIARLKELPNGIKKVSTKDGFKPGDLVRILDVPDSEYEMYECYIPSTRATKKAMIGKVCEVKTRYYDGSYFVYTPDKSEYWNFPPSALEKVAHDTAYEAMQQIAKKVTFDDKFLLRALVNAVGQHGDCKTAFTYQSHLTNKQTKPKTMLRTISDRLARALNADKKAMYEIGYIDENLNPTNQGLEALGEILFDEYESKIAEKAKAEVKRIKEEAKKK